MSGTYQEEVFTLRDENANLQRQLQQAQEELATWHQEFTTTHNGKSYQMDALEAGKMVQDTEAEARLAKQDLQEVQEEVREWRRRESITRAERDTAQGSFRFQQYLRMRLELEQAQAERATAIERAEAAEDKLLQGGTVVFTGLSVPKQELDNARAELAAQGDELRIAKRDAAEAQKEGD